jgi:hypothetical protein
MDAMWQRYGHPIRLSVTACAVVYVAATGVTILSGFGSYAAPYAQLALWAVVGGMYVTVAAATREVSPIPSLLLVLLLGANVASAADPQVGGAATAWVPNMIGAALSLVAFTGPAWRTLVMLGAAMMSNGLLVALRYSAGDPAGEVVARVVKADVGMLIGVVPALIIVSALRTHAGREAEQLRRTRAAQAERDAELAVQTDRRALLEPALSAARGLLAELAAGADPQDDRIRAACRATEQRLRTALSRAVDEPALVTLSHQLAAGSEVELVVQDSGVSAALPPPVREHLVQTLHKLIETPGIRRITLTLLPDGDTVWVSLTVDGDPPEDGLPEASVRPSARGQADGQWWLEWTLPMEECDDAVRRHPRRGPAGGRTRRRPFHVPGWRRVVAGTPDRREGAGDRSGGDGR